MIYLIVVFFGGEDVLYYIFNDEVRTAWDDSDISDIIKVLGIELQPGHSIEENPEFRLPTKDDFENLISHFSRWDDKRKGLKIENDNHEILFLPAAGQCLITSNFHEGCYWSSTEDENNRNYVYYLNFFLTSKYIDYDDCRHHGRSVRLVSDTPFEGGIEFDGVWWKSENEEGYFTFDEAISKFNK